MAVEWKEFEQAVATFLQALDPGAKVIHDKLTPDADTGSPRQRDVWIETSFGGHLRIAILVSCKRKKTKLSQQDLDAFVGELRSSGANKGVLYAYRGFTKPALAKAAKLGISCCILYQDRPPDIPEVLAFTAYCFREKVRLSVSGLPKGGVYRWAEALELDTPGEPPENPAVQLLANEFRKARPATTLDQDFVRPSRRAEISGTIEHLGFPLTFVMETEWVVYRAKLESWLVNGSYSLTDKNFRGTMITPAIDTFSLHPGPGWDQIDPREVDRSRFSAIYFIADDSEEALRRWALQETEPIKIA